MEFSETEIIFYAVAFVVSGSSCLARIWRDNESIGARATFGRCFSSGFFGCGAVAVLTHWHSSSAGASAFYLLAVAAFVGYLSRDFQDQVLTKVAKWITKKLDLDADEEDQKNK